MLNKQKGNMYGFVTHTWNTIKGMCEHDCSYCYMKRFNNLKPIRFDEKELKTDLGENNFIFVGSSNDMFSANGCKIEWIDKTLEHCRKFDKNEYLFQTKNPAGFNGFSFPENSTHCVTLETNRHYKEIMRKSPDPEYRAESFIWQWPAKRMVTIEPILDFDLGEFVEMIIDCAPSQVNIGADSCGHQMPEPPKEKVLDLIVELSRFTRVHQKSNLKRLLK